MKTTFGVSDDDDDDDDDADRDWEEVEGVGDEEHII